MGWSSHTLCEPASPLRAVASPSLQALRFQVAPICAQGTAAARQLQLQRAHAATVAGLQWQVEGMAAAWEAASADAAAAAQEAGHLRQQLAEAQVGAVCGRMW